MPRDTISVKLKPCCVDTLQAINDAMRMAKALQKFVFVAPWLTGIGNPAVLVFTITATDWTRLTDSLRSIPTIYRGAIVDAITIEQMQHAGELAKFWDGMRASVDS